MRIKLDQDKVLYPKKSESNGVKPTPLSSSPTGHEVKTAYTSTSDNTLLLPVGRTTLATGSRM